MAGDRSYAAFLRGVSPMNAKMAELKEAFEAAGFKDVRTALSSGNVVFTARAASPAALGRKAEAAMAKRLGRSFLTIVRPIAALREMLSSDPYRAYRLDAGAKRVITFLRDRPAKPPTLPVVRGKARILTLSGSEAFSAYVPDPGGPDWMRLIEETFGKNQTTRTWDTVTKVARQVEGRSQPG